MSAAPARTAKYRVLRVVLRPGHHILSWALDRGVAPRAFALLETTGRRTGTPRRTPVDNGLVGSRFWLIAAHGYQADYVRNIVADPRVRMKVRGRWRSGRAILLDGDDVQARSRTLPVRWDAAVGRALATTPVTVRIDLDPEPD